jgi:putative hydrolase of the HAD superfamily
VPEAAVLPTAPRNRPATTRAVLFDVDGVLVHGYHARPERQVRWDENLLADLGVDPDGFRTEFIYGIFVKQVVIGRMSLIEALERTLPALGYKGSAMQFVAY